MDYSIFIYNRLLILCLKSATRFCAYCMFCFIFTFFLVFMHILEMCFPRQAELTA